ncbi:CBL-interacting serine/threonine-protein kinase 23 [Nowakowskiella sp. JEL0078]|nr:CBL-interacting serine/threonine-protein kinase 23 [Nowakowskiella sp. JEL0078]
MHKKNINETFANLTKSASLSLHNLTKATTDALESALDARAVSLLSLNDMCHDTQRNLSRRTSRLKRTIKHDLEILTLPKSRSVPGIAQSKDHKFKRATEDSAARIVGVGGYSRVVVASVDNMHVAIKVTSLREGEKKSTFRARVAREVAILENVRCVEGVVEILGVEEDESSGEVFMVMEFVEGGQRKAPLNQREALCNFRKMVETISCVHSLDIIHRDIKPANILFTSNGILKLTDFGSAADKKNLTHMLLGFGSTSLWAAPETTSTALSALSLTNPKEANLEALDVYSIGVLFIIMHWGYLQMDEWLKKDNIEEVGFAVDHPALSGISEPGRTVITKMVERNPKMRISLADVISNEWFQNIEKCDGSEILHDHTHH